MIRLLEQLAPQKGGVDFWVCGQCVFCGIPTRFWHEDTASAVCLVCAKTHMSSELKPTGVEMPPLKDQARLKERNEKRKRKIQEAGS